MKRLNFLKIFFALPFIRLFKNNGRYRAVSDEFLTEGPMPTGFGLKTMGRSPMETVQDASKLIDEHFDYLNANVQTTSSAELVKTHDFIGNDSEHCFLKMRIEEVLARRGDKV